MGAVRIVSRSDGAVLDHCIGSESDGRFDHAIDSAGDANSDGVQDSAVGAPFAKALRGVVSLIDGSTGSELYEIEGDSNKFRFGFSVAGVGDFDGVGAPSPGVLGLFFYGAQEGNPPLGDGILCMTGPTFRPGNPQQVSPDGSSIHIVGFTVPPAAPGLPGEIAAGDT